MSRNYKIRIGYWDKTCRERLYYPGAAHGFLCAPARSGKFTCSLGPMLGEWEGSALSVDPKGQACAVTAEHRRKRLGQKAYRMDPFNLMPTLPGVGWVPPLARFDPMSSLDARSRTFGADADNNAEACLPYGSHTDSHWVDGGRKLVSGLQMALKARWPEETLVTVYRLISGPNLFIFAQDACQWAQANGLGDFVIERLARYAVPGASENKETLCMVSAASTALQFIGNACIADSLSETTFAFERMKREPITCYLVLPGQYLGGNCANWFRIVVGSFVDACMRETSRRVPVLGILDEFKSAVGKLGVVETAMGLSAGYGLQLLPVLQNLSQLQELYPQGGWETFLANSGFRIWYGPRDKTTSDYLSDMAGDREIRSVSKSLSEDREGNTQVHLSFAQHGRRYLLPYETRDLPGNEALIFAEGIPGVIRAGRKPYFMSKEFRFALDPYEAGNGRSRLGWVGRKLLGA